jgi:CubicO group peptidase (beta-lactamase class C family)
MERLNGHEDIQSKIPGFELRWQLPHQGLYWQTRNTISGASNMTMYFFGFLLTAGLLFSHQAKALDGEWLDQKVSKILEASKTPGLAVAIIKDGKIIYEKGFGLRDFESKTPVTPHTVFGIASTTKAFTATILAQVLGEKINDPIVSYLPSFALQTDEATSSVTMKDLLSHQSGVSAHQYLSDSGFDRNELFERLPFLGTYSPPGTHHLYNNNIYSIAANIAEKLTGSTWEDLITERILKPLEMKDTMASIQERCTSSHLATPYKLNAKREITKTSCLEAIPSYMAPAGGLGASVHDLAIWVQHHLKHKPLSELGMTNSVVEQLLAPVTSIEWVYEPIIPASQVPMLSDLRYGLGWIHQKYLGREWIWHGGNIDGYFAHVSFIPEENIGVIVVQNGSYASSELAVAFTIYDKLLKSPEERDYSHGFVWPADLFPTPELKPTVDLPHALNTYVGKFENKGYGVLTVKNENDEIKLSYGRRTHALNHFGKNKFEYIETSEDWMSGVTTCDMVHEQEELVAVECHWDGKIDPIRFDLEETKI